MWDGSVAGGRVEERWPRPGGGGVAARGCSSLLLVTEMKLKEGIKLDDSGPDSDPEEINAMNPPAKRKGRTLACWSAGSLSASRLVALPWTAVSRGTQRRHLCRWKPLASCYPPPGVGCQRVLAPGAWWRRSTVPRILGWGSSSDRLFEAAGLFSYGK